MKALIVLVLGLLAVGCGKTDTERLEQENRRLQAQLESKKHKAELEEKNQKLKDELAQLEKDDLLRLDVLGEYELTHENGNTSKQVFLENGIYEHYFNGKKSYESKWSIIIGEIQVKYDISGYIYVHRINTDKSITWIADIKDSKRTDLQGDGDTFKKIK